MEVPSNATINEHRIALIQQRLSERLEEPIGSEAERAVLAGILERLAGERGCSPEQLALAALQLSLRGKHLLLEGEENWAPARAPRDRERPRAGEGNARGHERGPRSGGPAIDGPPEANMERFRIEVGWRDRVKPGNIVGALANQTGLNGRAIGRIRIFDSHSTVDLPRGMPEHVFNGLRRLRVMNRELQISRLQS